MPDLFKYVVKDGQHLYMRLLSIYQMKHKIEAIDYLRGLSILLIIFIHIILPAFGHSKNDYSSIKALFDMWSVSNFCVVIIVICSGFSLYMSAKNLSLSKKDIFSFYKKRLKRLLLPWWMFCIIYFIFYGILKAVFNLQIADLSPKYIILSFFTLGGIPFGWLVFLMVMLTLIFPFLKYIYEKGRTAILMLLLAYLASIIVATLKPLYFNMYPDISLSAVSGISFIFSFILGWSLIYMLGFFLEALYNENKLMKKDITVTFNFIILFLVVHIIYKILGLKTVMYLNKYPPTPYYLTFGIASTFIILNLFFAYKHFIHKHLKNLLSYFSTNSYWMYLWGGLTLGLLSYLFSYLTFINTYLRLVLEFVVNLVFIALLILLQKKLVKIEMYLEKHHF